MRVGERICQSFGRFVTGGGQARKGSWRITERVKKDLKTV